MYNQHQHLKSQEKEGSLLKEQRSSLMKVTSGERGGAIGRMEGFISRMKKVGDEKVLSQILSGHYVSANPERHKYRERDELLPKTIRTYE
jgi:hypothetical protein